MYILPPPFLFSHKYCIYYTHCSILCFFFLLKSRHNLYRAKYTNKFLHMYTPTYTTQRKIQSLHIPESFLWLFSVRSATTQRYLSLLSS